MTSLAPELRGGEAVVGAAAVLVAAALGYLCAHAPRTALELMLALVVLALTLSNLLVGLVIFMVVTFPTSLPHAAGVTTVARPMGAALVVAWLVAIVRDGRSRRVLWRDSPLIAFGLVALVVWAFASSAWAFDPSAAVRSAARLAQVVVLLFVAYSAVGRRSELVAVAWAFVLAGALTSAYALASGATSLGGRLTGGITNANFLGAELDGAIVLSGFLFLVSRRPLHRVVVLASAAVCLVALIGTQSRGGAIGLGVAAVAAVVLARGLRSRLLAVILIGGGLSVAYFAVLASAAARHRLMDISTQSSSGRTDLWQIAFHAFEGHPLAGIGLGNFPLVENNFLSQTLNLLRVNEILSISPVVHNMYLEFLTELGVVGLLLFLLPVLGAFARMREIPYPQTRDQAALMTLAAGMGTAVVALLAVYMFDSGEYQKQIWLLLGFLLAATTAAMREHNERLPATR
jgi:O-antigen ligase